MSHNLACAVEETTPVLDTTHINMFHTSKVIDNGGPCKETMASNLGDDSLVTPSVTLPHWSGHRF